MLKKLLIVLLVLVLLFVIGGFVLPADYALARSIEVTGSPAQVHALVGELRQWDKWSPWVEADPTIVTTLGAQTSGVGAHQSWTSKDGPGELTFTSADPAKGITYDMLFDSKHPSKGWIEYAPVEGGKTKETWRMEGSMATMPVIGPYLAQMMGSMVGPMFDRGLERLRTSVETM